MCIFYLFNLSFADKYNQRLPAEQSSYNYKRKSKVTFEQHEKYNASRFDCCSRMFLKHLKKHHFPLIMPAHDSFPKFVSL